MYVSLQYDIHVGECKNKIEIIIILYVYLYYYINRYMKQILGKIINKPKNLCKCNIQYNYINISKEKINNIFTANAIIVVSEEVYKEEQEYIKKMEDNDRLSKY